MPTLSVRLSGGYDFKGLDRLIHLLGPILTLNEPSRILLDLRRVIFLGPSALALLTAALKRVAHVELLAEGEIQLPDSESLSRYLSRMDFVKILAGETAAPGEDAMPLGFRPCRHFVTDVESHHVARELAAAIAEKCDADDAARFSVNVCLNELAENVIYHSESAVGGFAAAGGWSKSNALEVVIVDLGIGIRGSLTKNPLYADISDDLTAIQTALEPRVTATPERNSGIGLFVTKLLLRENGGLLLVRSGEGAVYAGAREDQLVSTVALPGTLVTLRARADRPLNIRNAFRKLDEADGDNDAAAR